MNARIFASLLAAVFLFGISGWVFPATAWTAEAARTSDSPTAIPLIIHLPGAKANADALPEAEDSPAQVEPAPSASNRAEPDVVSDRDTPSAVAGDESAAADPAASGSTDTTKPAAGTPETADTAEASADPQRVPGDSASPPESDPAAGAQDDQNPEEASREENTPPPEVETEAPRSPRILLY